MKDSFNYHYYRVEDERGIGVGDCDTIEEAYEHVKALKNEPKIKGLKILEIGVIKTIPIKD